MGLVLGLSMPMDAQGQPSAKRYTAEEYIDELAYADELGDKPRIVALNKIDALDSKTLSSRKKALEKASGGPVFAISGVAGKNLQDVLRALMVEIRAEAPSEEVAPWQP